MFSHILKKGNKPDEFVLVHFRENFPITYNISGWINMCRDSMGKTALALLHDSSKFVKSFLINLVNQLDYYMI